MKEIAPGVAVLPIIFVNVYLVGQPGGEWVLVDTGIPGSADKIRKAVQTRFGEDAKPTAIILTHGHFDHAGSARELADGWNVPIYAHRLELPYLTGKSDYPPQDPTVGGAIALMSRVFSTRGMDLGDKAQALPPDGVVPNLPDWEWLATSGHAPGHISLFRRSDKTLVAGDALATENMDSYVGIATQAQEIANPPAPFNYDWDACRTSVQQLAGLSPFTVGAGHGKPMSGPSVAEDMRQFVEHFTPPTHGRYIPTPARADETGVVSVPPPASDPLPAKLAAGVGIALLAGFFLRRRSSD